MVQNSNNLLYYWPFLLENQLNKHNMTCFLMYVQQEPKNLILLIQKDVLAHFNKIVLQNGNVMKCFGIIVNIQFHF